ncbi:hypothetical protein XENOCAPTIV_020489, partial [Xenoophorus captivus]
EFTGAVHDSSLTTRLLLASLIHVCTESLLHLCIFFFSPCRCLVGNMNANAGCAMQVLAPF